MPARRLARWLLVLPAADKEAVLRAGQRDVKQTAIFLQMAQAQRLPRPDIGRRGQFGARAPQRQPPEAIGTVVPQHAAAPVRKLHRIGQKDYWRFETLGAVHGQNAQFVALTLAEIALDLDVAGSDPAQKPL